VTVEDPTSSEGSNDLEGTVVDYSDEKLEEENRILKQTVSQLRNEVEKYRSPALMVAEVVDPLGDEEAVIKVANGNKFMVQVSGDVDDIVAGESVLVEQKNLTVVDTLDHDSKFNVEKFVIVEKPDIGWSHVGGLDDEVQEIQEVIEMPLREPEKFKRVGIEPPKGILLHGPPGTGKTLMAKAVASSTDSTFIEIVGSELVQKFIGEGAKLVKEVFELARQKAPSIVFIDELDALAARRVEIGTSGEREVQRTFMQLLAELDGFDALGEVKVIGCTNRRDILDPAILRPGRLDRQIEVPAPDIDGVKEIFDIHTDNMDLCDCEEYLFDMMEGLSGAEIKSVCTEAGYFAIRDGRTDIQEQDISEAVKKVKEDEDNTHLQMFG
jgi:proteasome regulatory subunit